MAKTSERVVLLVDSSTMPLLEQAARLAALVHGRLEVVFIQDDDLLQVASLPFSREVVLHTGMVRSLSRERLRQEANREFEQFRTVLQQMAGRLQIHWDCRRHSGSRRDAWRDTVQEGLLFAGGMHTVRRTVRSSHRLNEMLYAVYNGTESGRKAVQVARNAAEADGLHLVVLIPETPEYPHWHEEVRELLQGIRTTMQLVPVHHPDSMPSLKIMVEGLRGSMLFLPRELVNLSPAGLDELLQVVRLPVILVY